MQLSVTGKQVDVGDALRVHVERSLTATIGKYFANPTDATVVLSREGHDIRADIKVHVGRGIILQGHAEAGDAYAAFEAATEHIGKRLRRQKRRMRDHQKSKAGSAKLSIAQPPAPAPEATDQPDRRRSRADR